MNRDIAAEERAQAEFGYRQEDRPLERRQKELGISGLERTERQGVRLEGVQAVHDEAAKVPLEEVLATAGKLNTNGSELPFIYQGAKGKDKYGFQTIDPRTGEPGKEFVVNEAQMRQLFAARRLGEAGYGAESLAALSSVHKDIADTINRHNEFQVKLVGANNDAAYRGGALRNEGIRLAETERHNRATEGLTREHYSAMSSHYNKPDWLMLENAKGEPVAVDKRRIEHSPDGTVKLPAGLRWQKDQTADFALVSRRMQEFEKNNPTATVDDKARFRDQIMADLAAFKGREFGGGLSAVPPGWANPGATAQRLGGNAAPAAPARRGLAAPPRDPQVVTKIDGNNATFVDAAGVEHTMPITTFIEKYTVHPAALQR